MSVQASLFLILSLANSLSITTREQSWNELSPNWQDRNATKSIHDSDSRRVTAQRQRSEIKHAAYPPHFSHFNHFQGGIVLNLTHPVPREAPTTHLQLLQLLTILQCETAIWIRSIRLLAREAVLSDHHAFQLIQANDLNNFHRLETVGANLNHFQRSPIREIKNRQLAVIATTTINNELCNGRRQTCPFLDTVNSRIGIMVWNGRMVHECPSVYSLLLFHASLLSTLNHIA